MGRDALGNLLEILAMRTLLHMMPQHFEMCWYGFLGTNVRSLRL